eukprot:8086250-Alexandrium_andersonii.AAC.1
MQCAGRLREALRRLRPYAHRRAAWTFLARAWAELQVETDQLLPWKWAIDCAQGLSDVWLGWARLQGGED